MTPRIEFESCTFSIENGVPFASVRRKVGLWDDEKGAWVTAPQLVGEVFNGANADDVKKIEALVGESHAALISGAEEAARRHAEQLADIEKGAAETGEALRVSNAALEAAQKQISGLASDLDQAVIDRDAALKRVEAAEAARDAAMAKAKASDQRELSDALGIHEEA